MFDTLIIGGSVSGMSCAMILGSAEKKAFVQNKKIGIITHQKASSLQDAIFYNAYGIPAGTLGSDLLDNSINQLKESYPHIIQIPDEKVIKVITEQDSFQVITNKSTYQTKIIVIGIGSSNLFNIEGLNQYIIPHQKSLPEKQRIQLKNIDHKVAEGIYVCGTLAGHRSQLAIAAGSGASVATDILVLWNDGIETHSHDSLKVK